MIFKLFKKVPLILRFGILLLPFLAFQNANSSDQREIAAAKAWFDLKIKPTSKVLPDWTDVEVRKNGGNIILDVAIKSDQQAIHVSKERQNISFNLSNANGVRRIIIKKDKFGTYHGGILRVGVDDDFIASNGQGNVKRIKFNPSFLKSNKVSGKLWLEDFDERFVEGYVYNKGKIKSKLEVYKVRNSTQLNTRDCFTTSEWVTEWYTDEDGNIVIVAYQVWNIICSYYATIPTNNNGTNLGNDWDPWQWSSGGGGDALDTDSDPANCNSSCQNSSSKESCYVSWSELGIEVKKVTTYISASLTDCKQGLSDGKTFSQGENASLVTDETELTVVDRRKLGDCKWRITYRSRPKITWQPTTVELTLMAFEKGIEVGFNTNPKTKECGPYQIAMDLGY
jgi:hypothetical protein